ncbi:MAG: hypothetical protein JKY94_01615 [Rhodobacteraceae bacterium]|nr:hypothetical protein [Paracoccaceae bacterium]
MNTRNEFLILAGLFALWLVSLSVWYVATGVGPPDGWSKFASDWGAIIAGSMALVGAALTVWKIQHQIEHSQRLEARREARDYAAEIRSFEAHLREALNGIVTKIISAHYFVANSQAHRVPPGEIVEIPDFPAGRLPDIIRAHVNLALNEIRQMGRESGDRTYLIRSLVKDPGGVLSKYDNIEIDVLVALVAMEGYARAVTDKSTLDLEELDIGWTARDMGMCLTVAAYCKKISVCLQRNEVRAGQATFFTLCNVQIGGED